MYGDADALLAGGAAAGGVGAADDLRRGVLSTCRYSDMDLITISKKKKLYLQRNPESSLSELPATRAAVNYNKDQRKTHKESLARSRLAGDNETKNKLII